MTKRTLLLLALSSSVLLAQSTTLPPGQEAAATTMINFLGMLRTNMSTLLNQTMPSMVAIGYFLLFAIGVKNLLMLSMRTIGQSISSYHSHLQLPAYFLLLMRFAIANLMLLYCLHPMRGGITFPMLMPTVANALSQSIELDAVKSVLMQFNFALHLTGPSVFGNLYVAGEYLELMVVLAVAEVAMTIITSVSFLFVGALSYLAPLVIPFFVDFRWDALFWDWFKDMTVYSMQQVVADIFIAVFANMYLGFFCQILHSCDAQHPSFTFPSFVGELGMLMLITITFVVCIWRVPAFTSARFGGFGSLGQDFSNTLQRFVLAKVF